ncbi:hypothetical protein LCGC14_2095050 [marine sediment metagenome]|uniref:Uncharacterized protein n=1 Tax=marine sediment metagenome TaxID=412755 RepID=A0A0F9GPR2_9ZZZZ
MDESDINENRDNVQPDSGVDLEGRIAWLETELKEAQENSAQTAQILEQTQAERNVLQDQDDRLVRKSEPDRSERRDNVQQLDVRIFLACGCSPHSGADLEHIDGCPIDFVLNLQEKQAEMERQLKGVLELMTRIIEGEPLIGFVKVRKE